MDSWLDSLSEDWISEPRSSHSNPNIDVPLSPAHSSPKSNLSQSRIPRYKPRSTSNLSVSDTAAPTRNPSGQKDRRTTSALSESSCSDLNAAQPQGLKGALQPSYPGVPRPSGKRLGSASSLSHVPQDTVQHKPSRSSPARDPNFQNTPDWKRRIIQGKIAPGDQCDLFSPIGLEKVFRPPKSGPRGIHGRGVATKHSQPEEYPSSPPLYPLGSQEKSDITSQGQAEFKSPALPIKRNSKNEGHESDYGGSSRVGIDHRESSGDNSNKHSMVSNTSSGIKSRPKSAVARSSKIRPIKRQARSSSGTPTRPSDKSNATTYNPLPRQSPDSSMRQDDRDENISPFFISRHQTLDGRVDYAALDMSVSQLRRQVDKLRLEQQGRRSPCSSDYGVDYTEAKSAGNSSLLEVENDWTAHSLPDDLSMGTDAFVAHGGFVNMRRGGYSNDGSFQRRPLSPSSLPAFDIPESRSNAPSSRGSRCSAETVVIPPETEPELPLPAPTTPGRRQPKEPSSPARTQSSGSPLKLFDKYDTFTNDRVSRRISKFEENMRESPDQDAVEADYENIDSSSKGSRHPKVKTRQNQVSARSPEHSQRRTNGFGKGELDNHSFSSSQPSKPGVSLRREDVLDLCSNWERDSIVSHLKLELHPKSPDHISAGKKGLGSVPMPVSQRSFKATTPNPCKSMSISKGGMLSAPKDQDIHNEHVHNAQGKRLPHSPIKDPQSKRRRTLKISEEASRGPQQSSLNTDFKITVMNSLVGKKRKDALYDGQNQVADAETLAMRKILRPRTSTTGHNEFHDRGAYVDMLIEAEDAETRNIELAQGPTVLQNPRTEAVTKQVAGFSLDTVENIKGSRKASVSTADFFSEAQQIMRVIRAQGRPLSSQKMLQEAEPYHEAGFEEAGFEEAVFEQSPKDGFSRPPSRAGASLRRLREPVQLDARVVSHLRKFEEKGDFEVAFSSSFKSVQLEQVKNGSRDADRERDNLNDEVVVESDPPNLRIYRQLPPQHGRTRSPRKTPASPTADSKARSLGSLTSGPSTGRSLPTGSSHGSGTKATIVPETVSHLLTDQIAGMKYDQDRQVWIKSQAKESMMTPLKDSSEMTEDVLGDIPDLTVDEVEEMHRIQDHACSFKRMGSNPKGVSEYDNVAHEGRQLSQNDDDARPRTAEGAISTSEENSPARSKYSRLASSGPVPETRATSWGGDMPPGEKEGIRTQFQGSPRAEDEEDHEEEVEHEISILEGRSSKTPTRSIRREHHARVVTVSFSSPLVGHLQTPYPPDIEGTEPEAREDGFDLDLDDSPIRFDPQPGAARSGRRSSFDRKSGRGSSSRRISINSQSYIARPMTRLDEEDEIDFLQTSNNRRNTSIDVIVSTPLSLQRGLLAPKPPSSGQGSSVGFHLSPLQDFTIHQTDQSDNQGHGNIVRRRGLLAEHETQKFALVTQHLVKKLTDLEPFEPHWDSIRCMNLQNQGLATLHKLDDFCGRLEELDVSNNSLDQLDGAPSSIRDLRICRNHLSDLSTWGHLYNLQYLDVSRNHIQTFKAFQQLVHLRELKADDNEIESLDGLFQLDGLLSLRLRGNSVRMLDFEGSNL